MLRVENMAIRNESRKLFQMILYLLGSVSSCEQLLRGINLTLVEGFLTLKVN